MLTTVLSFVVVLGILILIHELGHFIVARLAGVGVERFSIGFGPVLWRIRGRETEYCISAIPMGGYVKMMGDDENPLEGGRSGAMDAKRAFNLKPLWTRFLIVFAGPGMNFVLAAAIFALVYMVLGRPELPAVIGRVVETGPAAQAGLRAGDRILAVAGRPVAYWSDVDRLVQDRGGQPVEFAVRSAGEATARTVMVRAVRGQTRDLLGDRQDFWDLGVRQGAAEPPRVGEVEAGGPAAQAGLRSGDVIVSVQGRPVASFEELAEAISRRPGQPTDLVVRRGQESLAVTVTPRPERVPGPEGRDVEVGRIRISQAPVPPANVVFVRSNPFAAVGQGIVQTAQWTAVTVKVAWRLLTARLAPSNIGGPIQIAVAAGDQARRGLADLAFFTAVISINLAVLNLLPVPMLDGGHLLFFAFEAVLGRPLSIRKREVAQQVGFVLLMMLMLYAVYNDLNRLDVFRIFR